MSQAPHHPYTPAILLYNLPNGDCDFTYGSLPHNTHFSTVQSWLQNHTEAYEQVPHPAPRVQYVVTLKGRLQFQVTNGTIFILEPGIILIAADTKGPGHTWKLLDGDEWLRLYIPLADGEEHHFIPRNPVI